MLKKKLGIESIEADRNIRINLRHYYKIPSTLIIPDGVEKIGYRAFSECPRIKKVEISGSVKNIGGCAFGGCRKLKKVEIPKSVDYIGVSAFAGCGKAEIIIENTEEGIEIEPYAFFECKNVEYVKEKTRNRSNREKLGGDL